MPPRLSLAPGCNGDYNKENRPETSRGAAAKGSKTGKPSGAKHIVNHPAVQQAIEILGAELIEVKPPKGLDPTDSR